MTTRSRDLSGPHVARATPGPDKSGEPWAVVGGQLVTELVDVTDDLGALDTAGFWVVVISFEGAVTCARFARRSPLNDWYGAAASWHGAPARDDWSSSLEAASYQQSVETIRDRIAAGDVYQVNLCRLLSAPMPEPPDIRAMSAALARGNPAPHAATVCLPSHDIYVVSASPELFLRRDGADVASSPIKGTGRIQEDLTDKDVAENVMIVDLVRNDLGRIATTGSVTVPSLLAVEQHPGLVHLVSTVDAQLKPTTSWADIVEATFPPGSVTGAPKSSALRIINELEPTPRGVYTGAVGWVDADNNRAELAVAIRTFQWRDGRLHLGTGAGITWGSDPRREWEETELKVSRLLQAIGTR
jgi:para-aminobenzoate synthetase component 1